MRTLTTSLSGLFDGNAHFLRFRGYRRHCHATTTIDKAFQWQDKKVSMMRQCIHCEWICQALQTHGKHNQTTNNEQRTTTTTTGKHYTFIRRNTTRPLSPTLTITQPRFPTHSRRTHKFDAKILTNVSQMCNCQAAASLCTSCTWHVRLTTTPTDNTNDAGCKNVRKSKT